MMIDQNTYKQMTKGERISAIKHGKLVAVRSERERQLRSRYDLTLEHYDDLFNNQNGLCAICKESWKNDLYVDHDHDTNEVRGLVCARCNALVRFIEYDKELIPIIEEYLR